MQVNRVQQSPNFTALKIKPSAQKALENTSKEFLNKLNRIGEDLSETKYYDMIVDENLCPHIDAGNLGEKYRPPFNVLNPRNTTSGNCLCIDGIWDGATEPYRSENRYTRLVNGLRHIYTLEVENREAALSAYEKFNTFGDDLEKGAYLTKLLDQDLTNLLKKYCSNIVPHDNIKEGAAQLIEKFGMK